MLVDDHLAGERAHLCDAMTEALEEYRNCNIEVDELLQEIRDTADGVLLSWMSIHMHAGAADWETEIFTKGDRVPAYYGWSGWSYTNGAEVSYCLPRRVTQPGTVVLLFRLGVSAAPLSLKPPVWVQAEAMPQFLRGDVTFNYDVDEGPIVKPSRETLEAAFREATELLDEGFDL